MARGILPAFEVLDYNGLVGVSTNCVTTIFWLLIYYSPPKGKGNIYSCHDDMFK